METHDETASAPASSLERVVSEQTFADQIRLAVKARKYSKWQLVAKLIESDRMLRADAKQINALGDEVRRLKELLANDPSSATAATERNKCNQSGPPPFAEAHG